MHDFADGYSAGAMGRAPIRELNRGFLPHCPDHQTPEGVGFLPGPVHKHLRACAYMRRGGHTHGNTARQDVGGLRTKVLGQQKQSNDPCNNQHTQTAHPSASSTAPTHQRLGSANVETTPAGAPATATNRRQRPDATCERRATVQGPVKKQQPNGMSHTGGGGRLCGDGFVGKFSFSGFGLKFSPQNLFCAIWDASCPLSLLRGEPQPQHRPVRARQVEGISIRTLSKRINIVLRVQRVRGRGARAVGRNADTPQLLQPGELTWALLLFVFIPAELVLFKIWAYHSFAQLIVHQEPGVGGC